MNMLLINDIIQEFSKSGIPLDEQAAALFMKYYQLLVQENNKYNLTRIISPENVLEEHFLDPLIGFRLAANRTGERLLDLGSGAGFPGIPLKIFLPDLKLTIVDASQKKINFLHLLIREIGLNDITLMHIRAEDLGRGKERERYPWVAARGLAPLTVAAELALPLVKEGGYFWAFKGPNALDELQKAEEIIRRCGGNLIDKIYYRLPKSNKERVILIFRKSMKSERIFPRKAGIPKKRPLEKK
jgi:16S rRNA (guanine527-N7)-methyltransferase